MNSMGSNAGSNATVAANQMPQVSSMGSSAGSSSLADLYRIQIEAGDLENNMALLKNQQNTLVAQFNSYLNRPAISRFHYPTRWLLIPWEFPCWRFPTACSRITRCWAC